MHEWALANAIVETLLAHTGQTREVKLLEIRLGRLQSVAPEDIEFWVRELLRERGISVGEISFVEEDVVLRCRRCGHEWKLDPSGVPDTVREYMHFVPETVHAFFRCPKCGSRDYEVVSGRGVSIGRVVYR